MVICHKSSVVSNHELTYQNISVLYKEGWENYGKVFCTFTFNRKVLLSQTHFLSQPNALEACVSSSASSPLMLVTCPLSLCHGQYHKNPRGGWYTTSVFLILIFILNSLVHLEKWVIISCAFCWSCATKAVLSANIRLHTRTFLDFLANWHWTSLLLVYSVSIFLGWNQGNHLMKPQKEK